LGEGQKYIKWRQSNLGLMSRATGYGVELVDAGAYALGRAEQWRGICAEAGVVVIPRSDKSLLCRREFDVYLGFSLFASQTCVE